jgi:bifunctional UDP-N-acetylglucosamine pyrophosphorylase/glucosamine-1-phosphate N-acetyltransferase
MGLSVVILAAGQGKRMRSRLPKALHLLAGRPLLEHVYHTATQLPRARIHIVYGYGGEQVRESLPTLKADWIEQPQQLGTGHAVRQVLPQLKARDTILILYGDVPLITSHTLTRLMEAAGERGLGLLTVTLTDPSGYGRILRDKKGHITAIIEEKDADEAQRAIREVNTGMMSLRSADLERWVSALEDRNAQREYYLTDIIAMAVKEGVPVATVAPASAYEIMGVNDRAQLAELERYYQMVQAQHLMQQGVTIADPSRFDLRGDLEVGEDVSIDVNVVLEGKVSIGNNVRIEANNVIRDARISDDVTILPNCVIEGAIIGKGARIGPFARLRPGTLLAEETHIGNFVEVKKSRIGKKSKVNHLSYIGDAEIGRACNVGAGTITCNYNGAHKHKTIIGNDVFIGSGTQLVAPVKVGDGATLGAGTTLVKDAPPRQLTISRAAQRNVRGWKRPTKNSAKKK